MDWKQIIALLKAEILVYMKEAKISQGEFARRCGMKTPNFNAWLNSKKGMNFKSFCDMYEAMHRELKDIADLLQRKK